jgi:hypothetical protein
MNNHYHLLIKTPEGNLSRVMRHINGVYTQKLNRRLKTDGPLFRGRYKAIVITGDSYLLQVSRYIHLNPVSARIVRKAETYGWSSYLNYLALPNEAPWVKTRELLQMTSNKKNITAYRQFVEKGIDEETKDFYRRGNQPVIFGERKDKDSLLENLTSKKIKASKGDYQRTVTLPSLERISKTCARSFNVKESTLFQARRGRGNEARKVAIYGSRMWNTAKLSLIAERYGCKNHSSISNTVKRMELAIKTDQKLARLLKEIYALVMR